MAKELEDVRRELVGARLVNDDLHVAYQEALDRIAKLELELKAAEACIEGMREAADKLREGLVGAFR